MEKKGLSDQAFAVRVREKCGLDVSESAVLKWRRRERIPRPEQMRAIRQATRGAVKPDDWINGG